MGFARTRDGLAGLASRDAAAPRDTGRVSRAERARKRSVALGCPSNVSGVARPPKRARRCKLSAPPLRTAFAGLRRPQDGPRQFRISRGPQRSPRPFLAIPAGARTALPQSLGGQAVTCAVLLRGPNTPRNSAARNRSASSRTAQARNSMQCAMEPVGN